jgi:cobalt-zinc-cadmium efflux system membrane fusion protein
MKTIIIFTLLCCLFLNACSTNTKDTAPAPEHHDEHEKNLVELTTEQFKAVGITLGTIEQKNLHSVVKASGYLEVPPQNKATVSSLIGAVVKQILVVEGIAVKQGQTLALLEHPDFIKLQEEYLSAKSTLAYSDQEFRRQKELSEQNAAAAKIFQKTESEHTILTARVASLEEQLRQLSVRPSDLAQGKIVSTLRLTSPISGYVGHINASIGAYAEPSKTLFEISDNSKIHVDLLVYEKDLFKVKLGQKVSFVLANQPEHQQEHKNETIEGVIFGINKSFEGDTKALTVHAQIKNEHHELIPGMFVSALIDVGSQTVMAVASDAVVKSGGKQWIFVVAEAHEETESAHSDSVSHKAKPEQAHDEHGHADHAHEEAAYHFKMVEVVTGITELGYTEITPVEELSAESKVVIKNSFFLLSKAKESEGGDEHGH